MDTSSVGENDSRWRLRKGFQKEAHPRHCCLNVAILMALNPELGRAGTRKKAPYGALENLQEGQSIKERCPEEEPLQGRQIFRGVGLQEPSRPAAPR
jgi:hypothetical protein